MEIEFSGQLERFLPESFGANFTFIDDGELTDEFLMYSIPYLPTNGRYGRAWYQIGIEFHPERPSPVRNVGEDVSTVAFSAAPSPSESEVSGLEFMLTELGHEYDYDNLSVFPERLPDWYVEGDSCYVTVELTYDHELTVTEQSTMGSGTPESEVREMIEEKRTEWVEKLDRWREES